MIDLLVLNGFVCLSIHLTFTGLLDLQELVVERLGHEWLLQDPSWNQPMRNHQLLDFPKNSCLSHECDFYQQKFEFKS
jgi:hypothetical protein